MIYLSKVTAQKRYFALLFFLSGITGLIYQLLWVRKFTYLLGSAYVTVSVIVASFMAGLLLGAWLIGKVIERMKNPLRWYGMLEAGVGLYAFLFVAAFNWFDSCFGGVATLTAHASELRLWINSLLILLILLPPTCAMGATLPLLVHHFTKEFSEFRNNISLFYAINTLGAALGVLLAGFFLIERTGITNGILLTGGLNVLIGAAALILSLEADRKPKTQPLKNTVKKDSAVVDKVSVPKISGTILLSTAFLSGFVALALEIIWTRALKFLIQSSTYSFTIILFVFLLGLAAGGLIAQRMMKRYENLVRTYGILQILLAVTSLFTVIFLYRLAYTDFFQHNVFNVIFDFSRKWFSGILIYALTCGIVFLLPTVLMGILFPMLNQLYLSRMRQSAGASVSRIYAVNTFGSIAGALASGFILIPMTGLKWSITAMSVCSLLLGFLFVRQSGNRLRATGWVATAAFGILVLLSMSAGMLNSREEVKSDRVLYYNEGLSATVKVYEAKNSLNMSIDGMNIASTSPALLQKEILIAQLPFFIYPEIHSALSVGLASGISTAAVAAHAGVNTVDCVELIQPVFEASTYFSQYNHHVTDDSKVNFIHDDIYAFLKFSSSKYDMISSDGKLGTLDNANTTMLSSDYYEQCKRHLNPRGVFIQWIPLITPSSCFDVILQTMKKSFRHVSLFYFYPSDVFMVGTEEPVQLDLLSMNEVMKDKATAGSLASVNYVKASEIMCGYIGEFESAGQSAGINTMNQPVLEFLFYRDWKKADEHQGGYRAANLQHLVNNFSREKELAFATYHGLPGDEYARGIYASSLNFFSFCIDNFRQGSYETGKKEYEMFKSSIPF